MRVQELQNKQFYLSLLFLDVILNTLFSNTLSPYSSLKVADSF